MMEIKKSKLEKKFDEKKLNYQYVGKKTNLSELISKNIPKAFYPTSRTTNIFVSILIFVLLYGMWQTMAPLISFSMDFTSTQDSLFEMHIGWPLEFFGLTTGKEPELIMDFFGLIIDSIIYLIIAYGIDVLINLIFGIKLNDPKRKKRPREQRLPKRDLAEKITTKLAQKIEKPKPVNQEKTQLPKPV